MSFGLARGRELDPLPIAVSEVELPPLPDSVISDHEAGRIDPRAWFERPDRPLEIEIGSGKGTFLVQQAAVCPDRNFLGIEWAREFFLYAADRVRRAGHKNVRMLNTDASEFFRWRLPRGIASTIHLYFPDPWPKTRHHRRRMVQDGFLGEAHRVLVPGGELRVVTDHDGYWQWMREHFDRWAGTAGPDVAEFEEVAYEPPESALSGEVTGTNFERKYSRAAGGTRGYHATTLRRLES